MSPSTGLNPGLYAIADSSYGHPYAQACRLIKAGCHTVQIRAKDWSCERLIEEGQPFLSLLKGSGALVVINDHIEAAKTLGFSGVHLGQEDPDPALARATLGSSAIIGLSTHTVEQARHWGWPIQGCLA